jgi:hypothetical protein
MQVGCTSTYSAQPGVMYQYSMQYLFYVTSTAGCISVLYIYALPSRVDDNTLPLPLLPDNPQSALSHSLDAS